MSHIPHNLSSGLQPPPDSSATRSRLRAPHLLRLPETQGKPHPA